MEYLSEQPAAGEEVVAGARAEHLLAGLPWGVLLLSTQGIVLYLNPQVAVWWGVAQAEAQGQALAQVSPHLLPASLYTALCRVAEGEALPAGEYYLPATAQWLAITSQPDPAGVVLHWQDVTARKQYELQQPASAAHLPEPVGTEAALRQSEARYRSLFATMKQGVCLIEKVATAPGEPSDYYYLAVNEAFERHTGLTDVLGKTLRQVVPGLEPRIVAAYDDALASGETRYLKDYVATLGMWIAAEVIPDAQPGCLAVLFSNVTAQHRADQTLREKAARQAYLLTLSDALQPTTDALAIQATVAHTAMHYFGADRCCYCEIAGDTATIRRDAARPGLPSVAAVYSLRAVPLFKAMLEGRRPVVVSDVATSLVMEDKLKQLCLASRMLAYINVPVTRNGELIGNMCLAQSTPREWTASEVALLAETTERTWAAVERAGAEEALRRSEEEFRSLVTATSDTVYKMSPDWRYMHQLIGKKFLADTPHASGTWLEHYIPVADQPLVQAAIEAAIQAKTVFELEHRVIQADGRVGWTYSRAIPVLDAQGAIAEWLGAAQDVTVRKQAEAQLRGFAALLEQQVAERTQALQESRDLLHAVAESQTVVLSAFRAVRDAQHQLVDLQCIFVNSRAEQLAGGQAIVGEPYLPQVAEAERASLLDSCRRVMDTGVTEEREFARPQEDPAGWFRTIITKLGDGVLVSEEDITLRKQAEQERSKNLQLLVQSEEVAVIGSWDYERATGILTWSDGMYRLFGLPPAEPVAPSRYRDAAVPEDLPIAERIEHFLTSGAGTSDETLRLQIGDQVKTVRVKCVMLADEQGQPQRVLGVDLDISDVRRLEAENLTLRLDQQKALLLAILQAQEAERNRIAENLHNGLGQVLYAIKLQISQLDVPALHALPELNSVRSHVNHLLSEAIHQTRSLAHELMPITLTEQGLAHALRDICRGLSTPRLRFACHVWLNDQVLPLPLQTALYRLAQELAHNIAKHSNANQATLEFELLPGWASLRAEDNGRGFDPAATPHGLGLRLLHEAVEILGGTILLNSSPEYGTHIRLRIPISH